MSDDLRERQPRRDLSDVPPESGTRTDIGGSGGATPSAPGAAVTGAERVSKAGEGTAGEPGAGDEPGTPNPLDDVKHPTADE